jgi:hypothetical protein
MRGGGGGGGGGGEGYGRVKYRRIFIVSLELFINAASCKKIEK